MRQKKTPSSIGGPLLLGALLSLTHLRPPVAHRFRHPTTATAVIRDGVRGRPRPRPLRALDRVVEAAATAPSSTEAFMFVVAADDPSGGEWFRVCLDRHPWCGLFFFFWRLPR
jgi:hypothetical protein